MLTEGVAPGSRQGARVVTPSGKVSRAASPSHQQEQEQAVTQQVKPLSLELLDLSENEISCEGATDLAYALSYNKTLKVLNLGKNRIGDHGIEELLACLQFNQSIRNIVTLYNTSTDERVDRVLELRTAAVQALEDHLDRAQNREDYHETGFLVDRSGNYGANSVSGRQEGHRCQCQRQQTQPRPNRVPRQCQCSWDAPPGLLEGPASRLRRREWQYGD